MLWACRLLWACGPHLCGDTALNDAGRDRRSK